MYILLAGLAIYVCTISNHSGPWYPITGFKEIGYVTET